MTPHSQHEREHEPDEESQYDTARQSPEIMALFSDWQARSRRFREAAPLCQADLRYGPRERQTYDYFPVAASHAPLVVYIHGGYWQGGDRKAYSFLAQAFNERGYAVAMPSYSLCPEVRIGDMSAEVRAFVAHIALQTNRRPVLLGHSAGAHLAATILTGEPCIEDARLRPLVAMGVSGIYELAPLISTSWNAKLRLTEAEAEAASPRSSALPDDAIFLRAVGGDESSEFKRQSLHAAPVNSASAEAADCLEVPECNHYTVLNRFLDPASALSRMLDLAC